MRIKKNINLGKTSWSNSKFSELTDIKENYKFGVRVKRLIDYIFILMFAVVV